MDLFRAVFRARGEPVEVTVLRQGKEVKLKVTMPRRQR